MPRLQRRNQVFQNSQVVAEIVEDEPLEEYHERELLEKLRAILVNAPAASDTLDQGIALSQADTDQLAAVTNISQVRTALSRILARERESYVMMKRLVTAIEWLAQEEVREFSVLPREGGI